MTVPDDRKKKTMEYSGWAEPRFVSRVVRCVPKNLGGATLYARVADWRPHGEADPDNPPLWARPPLTIQRNVGNISSIDVTDFSIRGYRFHADLDKAEISLAFPVVEDHPETEEFDYFVEAGYYDGFPLPVYQVIEFRNDDYIIDEAGITARWMKLYDFTTEFRARGPGQLMFMTAGLETSAPGPLSIPIETVPISAALDWTPLHRLARYVAFLSYNNPDPLIGHCKFEARG